MGLTFVYLVLLAIVVLFVVAVVSAVASGTSGTGRVVLLAVVAVVVLASYVHAFRALALRRRARRRSGIGSTPDERAGVERRRRRGGALGLGAGGAALGGSVVAGAFLTVGSLAVVGLATTIVVDSLGRYLSDDDFYANQGVERWRAQHPGATP